MWSSPFPIDWNIRNLLNDTAGSETDYPGTTGTLIIFYSPDHLLSLDELNYSDINEVELAYKDLVRLQESGKYRLQMQLKLLGESSKQPDKKASQIDPLIVALLKQYAVPLLSIYEKLEPGYQKRISENIHDSQAPFERWFALRRDINRMEILLGQYRDQQKRSQRLLSELLKAYPRELPQTEN